MKRISFNPGDIPSDPGIYIFRDIFNKIIYIGKAVNLRKRVSQYFHPSRRNTADPKLRSLINSIHSWETKTVRTDSEALLLESRLIKEYSPYYNVLMRDDKRYLMIKLNLSVKYPKLSLARIRKNDGAKYFGPFPHGRALRQTIEFLSGYFRLRLCNSDNPSEKDRKYCMESKVKLCSEPCIDKVTEAEYLEKVRQLTEVLQGNIKAVVETLRQQMLEYASNQNFEKAATIRDVMDNIISIFGVRDRNFRFASIRTQAGTAALEALQGDLKIDRLPMEIEAFDISNLGEDFAVAGMVKFINGEPDKKSYRRFKIKSVTGINDYEMIHEVITRRYGRLLSESGKMPDLIMVDGGKGQLSSAIKALIGVNAPAIPVIGLAKRNEEIFLPGRPEPVILDKGSISLKLLQAIRDEVHRFSITYNRELRLKRIQESILDDIPGIGENRKKALLATFSSIREIRNSTVEEICSKTPCVDRKTAEKVLERLNN